MALVECRRQGAQVDDLVFRIIQIFRAVEAFHDDVHDVADERVVAAGRAVPIHRDRLIREELAGELALQEHFLTPLGAQPRDYFLTAFGAWIARSGRTLKALPRYCSGRTLKVLPPWHAVRACVGALAGAASTTAVGILLHFVQGAV